MSMPRRGLILMLLGILMTGSAWADYRHGRGHGYFGVVISPWVPYPSYYYPPNYYSPPVIVQQAPVVIQQPPVYVEQAAVAPSAPPPTNYWYYCRASRAYYPYVNECRGGWQRVLPQPPQ